MKRLLEILKHINLLLVENGVATNWKLILKSVVQDQIQKPYVVASFGYRDPAHAGFLDNSGALRIPLQYDALNGISAYGPADGAQSYSVTDGVITQYDLSTLMDPDYYSLYIVKDQQLAFSNDLLVEKVDFDWVMDGDFWTDLSFGLRASQRSNERNKTSEKHP